MKKLIILFLAGASILTFTSSCEDVLSTISTNNTGADEDSTIAGGLKEALKVGTDTAVSKLNITDGYFKDAAVKILLPEQMQNVIATFKSKSFTYLGQTITGETLYSTGFAALGISPLQSKEDDLILGLNRAAESAANEAKPIFVDAITSMSISDAKGILFGEDTAATFYLKQKTRTQLFNQFEPKMESALQTVKVNNKSVSTTYEDFVKDYNTLLSKSVPTGLSSSSTVGALMGLNTMAVTDLSAYSTNKGLDGLFLKVSEEEEDIRKDPLARVTQILKDVFSKLD